MPKTWPTWPPYPQMMDETPTEAHITFGNLVDDSILLWRYRLSHLNPESMKMSQIHKLIEGISMPPCSY